MSARRDTSLVLVAHRSSGVLPAAVAAFRAQAAQLGLAAEVVVVEHSEDAGEAERAAASTPDQLLIRPNRGYAAGVNAGVAAARGDVLLVANPDVELMPGALAALLAALDDWDVVGPQFELAGALFPPAEAQSPRAELARRRALRGAGAWRRYLRRELRGWSAVWGATAPRQATTLSGALLAFRVDLAGRVGPWDEEFFLYFEETDWLRRATRRGARLAVVPSARAEHRWGHAAIPEATGEHFASSRRRYYRKWFPITGELVLRAGRGARPLRAPAVEPPAGPAWRWLLSPTAAGFPAALAAPAASLDAAAAPFARAAGRSELTATAWNAGDGRLVGPFVWKAPAAMERAPR